MTENTRLVQQLKEFYHGEKWPAAHRFAQIARISIPEAIWIVEEEWHAMNNKSDYEK
ncbi:MAG: hypothetical protein WAL88_08365 [Nitrosotalea sp.]